MSVDREQEARVAEEVAIDLVKRADALFTWAFETRHTDPDPDAVPAAATALEAHGRALRELLGGPPL